MKKVLAVLASLIALLALSYFCFLDKVKTIQNNILSDINKAYQIADIDWIKPKLKGDGIYATRELILEGMAPNKEELEKANKIALYSYGISSVKKDLKLSDSNNYQKDKQVIVNNTISKEIENKLKKKIEDISHSTLKVTKDKDGTINLQGLVSDLDTQNLLTSHAKYLFKDRLNSEITVGDATDKLNPDLAILALDELSLLDEGNFTMDANTLNFRAKSDKNSIKQRVVAEFKNQNLKDINLNIDISLTKIKDRKEEKKKLKTLKVKEDKKLVKDNQNIIKKDIDKCQKDIDNYITKHHINFRYNSDKIDKKSFAILDKIVNILNRCDKKSLIISGHTDNIGNTLYNLHLSQKRADSVKRYLKSAGIKSQMISIGYGEKKPIVSNKTKEGRAKNRRIEFKVVDRKEFASLKNKLKNKTKKITKIEPKKLTKSSISIKSCQDKIDRFVNSKKIYFSLDKSKIEKRSTPILSDLIKVLKECPNSKLTIKSYTDSIGKKEDNMKLSQKKADTIKRYLLKHGIKKERIEAIGYGENDPIADNTTTSGRAKNRRVKFYIKEMK